MSTPALMHAMRGCSVITEAYHAEAELEKEFFDKHYMGTEYGTSAKKWKRLVAAYFNETQRKKEVAAGAVHATAHAVVPHQHRPTPHVMAPHSTPGPTPAAAETKC